MNIKYNSGLCFVFGILFVLQSTAQETIEKLSFLDSYVVSNELYLSGTLLGGLSGIDRVGETYYLVADDAKNPRLYTAKISVKNRKITNIAFTNVITLHGVSADFGRKQVYDLEAIVVDTLRNTIFLTSEGSIRNSKSPFLFAVSETGKRIRTLNVPTRFSAKNKVGPYHNGAFEGLCKSIDGKGLWTAMELPLKIDGKRPGFVTAAYPVRITYFEKDSGNATMEFSYVLASLERPEKGRVNINGLTALLAYNSQQFLVVERSYQSGYAGDTNRVRIFTATTDENTTNTLSVSSLKEAEITPAKKALLFDFESVKHLLSSGMIDNIEGITFGPVLANGNRTLLLVSDNNFNAFGAQENQFILLEIHTKKQHE